MPAAATFPEPPELVEAAGTYVRANPSRVRTAVQHWLEKANVHGVAPPAFVPLRPFIVAESVLEQLAADLGGLLARVAELVAQHPEKAGLSPLHTKEVGLLSDLAESRMHCWARPDGYWDGGRFQITELNVGNGAGVTAIETRWLNEMYEEMGLYDAVPELAPRDPVTAWKRSLATRSQGASQRAVGVILRRKALEGSDCQMFQGQMEAFLGELCTGSDFFRILDPDDAEGMAEIERRQGVFFQYGVEAMVALREGYRALADPDRRARWWLPPTCSLLEKNVLPLASDIAAGPCASVLKSIWVRPNLEQLLEQRGEWIVKSSINEKGVLWDDEAEVQELRDLLTLRGLVVPLVAQRRARVTRATVPVYQLEGSGPWEPENLEIHVESSPFLIDGRIEGMFGRAVPASSSRPVMSPPPNDLGLCITVGATR